jgi:hypothetical protein
MERVIRMHGMPRFLEYRFGPAAAFYSGSACGFFWGESLGRKVRCDTRHISGARKIKKLVSSLLSMNTGLKTGLCGPKDYFRNYRDEI